MSKLVLCATLIAVLGCSYAMAATPEAYQKRWNDPAVARRIQANIETYRKGDGTITVVDAQGKPASGVQVELRQTRHEFLFGCNAFVLGQLKTPENNCLYEKAFLRLFNFATVPLYWQGTEPTQGELRYEEGSRDIWRRPPADRFVSWAAKNGVTLKGHPLVWHAYNPQWLPRDAEAVRELYRKRFREIAGRYGDKFSIFDVVNESQVCPKKYPLYTPDRAYVAWAFKEVAPLFPKSCTLMINEVTDYNFKPASQNPYVSQIKTLLADGAAVRGIGLQFHFFRRNALDGHLASAACDPMKLLDLYEALGKFNLPLYITEITIPSAGPDGDSLQAEVVRNYYRLWFGTPAMAGITWWNLGDGTATNGENEAQGGLVDAEFAPKAAYKALDELINREWKTTLSVRTDAQGQVHFRGFYGKYQVKLGKGPRPLMAEIDHARSGAKTYRLAIQP